MGTTRDMCEEYVRRNGECTAREVLEGIEKNVSIAGVRSCLNALTTNWRVLERVQTDRPVKFAVRDDS